MPRYPSFSDTNNIFPGTDSSRILRLPEVRFRVGLSRSAIYKKMKEGTFPRQRRIYGSSSVGWLESDVTEYLNACKPSVEDFESSNLDIIKLIKGSKK